VLIGNEDGTIAPDYNKEIILLGVDYRHLGYENLEYIISIETISGIMEETVYINNEVEENLAYTLSLNTPLVGDIYNIVYLDGCTPEDHLQYILNVTQTISGGMYDTSGTPI
jgi:hypothetical protein